MTAPTSLTTPKRIIAWTFAGSLFGSMVFSIGVLSDITTPFYDIPNMILYLILALIMASVVAAFISLPAGFTVFFLIKLFGNSPFVWLAVSVATVSLGGLISGVLWSGDTVFLIAFNAAGLVSGILSWWVSHRFITNRQA